MRIIKHAAVAAVAAGIWAFSPSGTGTSASAVPTLDMLTDMTFTSGVAGALECQPILIYDDGTNFNVTSDIRLIIPATYTMTWNTSDTSSEILSSGTVVVNGTVSYANANKTCILNVTTASAAGDRIVVTGIAFRGWGAENSFDSLGMAYDATDVEQNLPANQGFCTGGVRLWSANNFAFAPTGAASLTGTLPTVNIKDSSATATITAANNILITIPNNSAYGTAPLFDTTVGTVTIAGADAAKVSTSVSYINGSRTCVLDVTMDFVAGSTITVTGLRFAITANQSYTADSLQLSRDGAFGSIHALDDKIFCIGPANVTMAAVQTISASANNDTVTTVTLVDHATTATILATNDIRLMILSTNTSDLTATGRDNLGWDITATGSPTYAGTASAKVTAGSLTAADSGGGGGRTRLLLIRVGTNFAAGDVLNIDGLRVDNALATATDICIGLIVQGFTDGDVTKAFGKVVSLVSAQNLTGTGAGTGTLPGSTTTGPPSQRTYGSESGCFLRGTERSSAQ